MFRVETGSNNLKLDQWPSSSFQERADYSWPRQYSRQNLPSSAFKNYFKNLGGAFIFSSVLAIGISYQIKSVNDVSVSQPVEIQPITRNVITFGPEVDFNDILVTQEDGVRSETLIFEADNGDTRTTISAEGS